ncbi:MULTISPECIES: fimbria/pilus periplasmic chaperone [Sphaerochaeta]|jgi:fimbrial chaperone protein|uniref:fimbria/pilus periplasmic chaperone n=1 Tax=Sphaerochaeta TaxID=399320 RepID=UPI0017E9953B|nr:MULTISPECIES: fimbria/pilus periplasmic chaperone [Sphaerochaeta]MDD2395384.1 fimbria/pilus periplasmic chaperone [Sphaerochaeta sp.]MDD3456703.1 fimbria/pilus periplasmic chaperone [Sphaerochaeta sp.]MEA5027921.1 fimbria/pilus periplasmic chaperone [Sphaerochaeta associata]NLA96829.1 fimbria/pilus periplasmic chaperone [Spirochaetales bacterium]
MNQSAKKSTKRVVLTLGLLLLLLSSVHAYQFSPLEQSFQPTGAESTKTYTIVNDSNDSIAISISALIRDQDAQGNEVNTPADAYFSIVPNKLVVPPQSSWVVRVQYRGPRTVTNELSFRLKAEQIPYSQGRASTDKGMFNFLYIYTTSLYVLPSRVVENVAIRSVAASTMDDGSPALAVTLANLGTVHQLLISAVVEIKDSKGNSVVLQGAEALPGIDGMNILAKKTVTKKVPWPEGLSRDSGVTYQATIKYTK